MVKTYNKMYPTQYFSHTNERRGSTCRLTTVIIRWLMNVYNMWVFPCLSSIGWLSAPFAGRGSSPQEVNNPTNPSNMGVTFKHGTRAWSANVPQQRSCTATDLVNLSLIPAGLPKIYWSALHSNWIYVCERRRESVCWFSTFCWPQFSWTGQSGCASGRWSLIPKTNCKAVCTFLCCCAPILMSLNLTEATEMQQAQLQDMYQSEINQNYPFDVCFPPKQHNRGSWKFCRCLEENPGTFSFCTFSKLSVKLFTNYTAKQNEI